MEAKQARMNAQMQAKMARVNQLTDKSQMREQMPNLIIDSLTSSPKPSLFNIGRSRQGSDHLNPKRPTAVRIRVPAELADVFDKKIAQGLNPPTVSNIDTAEEYERLPAGTVITSGKYKGIKLAEVTARKSNGTAPFRNYGDYRDYVIMKYHFLNAAFHLIRLLPGLRDNEMPRLRASVSDGSRQIRSVDGSRI